MNDSANVEASAAGAGLSAGLPPHLMMVRLLGGFRVSRMLDTLVQYDIAEHLAAGPKTADELAKATGTHARSLYRVLRAVAAFGVFAEDEHGRFNLTPDAELLRKSARGSVYPSVKVFGQPWHWNMWGGLYESLKTGRPAFISAAGRDFDRHVADDPVLAEAVAESKAAMYEPSDDGIVKAYDFSGATHIVDVAGGCGALLGRILDANPRARGTVYDRAPSLAAARRHLTGRGLEGRYEVLAGDWMERAPRGDHMLLRGVLHYYGDEDAIRVLDACRSAMAESDRLLVCEMLMTPGNQAFVGKFIDVESMLLTEQGRERSEHEYGALLERAGLRVRRVIPTEAPISVIEAVRASS